jgi:hypothetical protein
MRRYWCRRRSRTRSASRTDPSVRLQVLGEPHRLPLQHEPIGIIDEFCAQQNTPPETTPLNSKVEWKSGVRAMSGL